MYQHSKTYIPTFDTDYGLHQEGHRSSYSSSAMLLAPQRLHKAPNGLALRPAFTHSNRSSRHHMTVKATSTFWTGA